MVDGIVFHRVHRLGQKKRVFANDGDPGQPRESHTYDIWLKLYMIILKVKFTGRANQSEFNTKRSLYILCKIGILIWNLRWVIARKNPKLRKLWFRMVQNDLAKMLSQRFSNYIERSLSVDSIFSTNCACYDTNLMQVWRICMKYVTHFGSDSTDYKIHLFNSWNDSENEDETAPYALSTERVPKCMLLQIWTLYLKHVTCAPFYQQGWTLIPAWISNYIHL